MSAFCEQCGTALAVNARFCKQCGSPIGRPTTPSGVPVAGPSPRGQTTNPGSYAARLPSQAFEDSEFRNFVPYVLVVLFFCSTVIVYLDRINISVVAPKMMQELGWDTKSFGVLFTSFLLGYTLSPIPGGILADRWNPYRVLLFSVVGCSLFTALTPISSSSYGLLVVIRFCTGLCAGMSLPACAALNARLFSQSSYGRAQILTVSGFFAGSMLVYPLLQTTPWRDAFSLSAYVGGAWSVAWLLFTYGQVIHPQGMFIAQSAIGMDRENAYSSTAAPWQVMVTHQVLLLALSYFCLSFAQASVMSLQTYLLAVSGVDRVDMGRLIMYVQAASFIGVLAGGVLPYILLKEGFATRFARTQGPSIGIACAVPFLFVAAVVSQANVVIVCLSVFSLFTAMAYGSYWLTPIEFSPKQVGAISGVLVIAGSLANIAVPVTISALTSNQGITDSALPRLVAAAAGVAIIAFLLLYYSIKPEPIRTVQ